MPCPRQILHRPLRRLSVVQRHMRQRQLPVIAVDEQDRDIPLRQRPDQGKIGIGQAAFGGLHDDPAHIVPADNILQHDPFPLQKVVGKSDLNGVAPFKQIILNPLYGPGENIAVHIGGDHRNPSPVLRRHFPKTLHIGAASPPARKQPLLFQQAERVPHGLPGTAVRRRQLVFRAQLLSRLQLPFLNAFPQKGGKLQVFCFLFQTAPPLLPFPSGNHASRSRKRPARQVVSFIFSKLYSYFDRFCRNCSVLGRKFRFRPPSPERPEKIVHLSVFRPSFFRRNPLVSIYSIPGGMSIRFWEKRDFFTEIFLFRPFCKKAP